ncbi:hypothetical protein [Bacillus sp. ISL-37]|uniref:hypothetical protein n=1 Tax=Bacillus sp. ISL-37 TaxID=2819123 RepID=UPI001BE5C90D|nr:hypothetical protein [Bacillus sp. ISL-37]
MLQLNRWVDIVFQYLGKSLKTLPQKRDNRHITASALLVKDIEGVENMLEQFCSNVKLIQIERSKKE